MQFITGYLYHRVQFSQLLFFLFLSSDSLKKVDRHAANLHLKWSDMSQSSDRKDAVL